VHVDHNSARTNGDASSPSSSTLPSALGKSSLVRFTSDAVDADTSFDQLDALDVDAAAFAPSLRRMYSDSHSFMDGALSGGRGSSASAGPRMCTLPNLTRFTAPIDGDESAPLTVAGGSSAVALASASSPAADDEESRTDGEQNSGSGSGHVYCYTTKQIEAILANVVAQTAEQFKLELGQAGASFVESGCTRTLVSRLSLSA
jgi:hypothetical protein